MFTEVCQYLRNWFEMSKYFGEFIVSGNNITFQDGSALPLQNNQYFRVVGSVFNDGVHKHGDNKDVLTNETFTGAVWAMAVPPAVVSLVDEIDNWVESNANAISSPYQSESFGGYSYVKMGGNTAGSSSEVSWKSQFASRLSPWRKI